MDLNELIKRGDFNTIQSGIRSNSFSSDDVRVAACVIRKRGPLESKLSVITDSSWFSAAKHLGYYCLKNFQLENNASKIAASCAYLSAPQFGSVPVLRDFVRSFSVSEVTVRLYAKSVLKSVIPDSDYHLFFDNVFRIDASDSVLVSELGVDFNKYPFAKHFDVSTVGLSAYDFNYLMSLEPSVLSSKTFSDFFNSDCYNSFMKRVVSKGLF